MVCKTRMSIIQPPVTNIYGVLFIIGSVISIVGNVFSLHILFKMRQRPRSNYILISLALSDVLVGFIVSPISAYQMLYHGSLTSCIVDYTRIYFSVFFEGASVLTLAAISLDRYILMTKRSQYYTSSTKYMTVVLCILAWIIPLIAPSLRWVNYMMFVVVTNSIFIVPFFVLLVSYFFIAKAVRDQEKRMKSHQVHSFKMFVCSKEENSKLGNGDISNSNLDNARSVPSRSHLRVIKAVCKRKMLIKGNRMYSFKINRSNDESPQFASVQSAKSVASNTVSGVSLKSSQQVATGVCDQSECNKENRLQSMSRSALQYAADKSIDSYASSTRSVSLRSHLRVAKAVTLLLISYFICITPINIWLILDLINNGYPFMSSYTRQNLYLFSVLAISYNSCVNAFIYFWKNPEFRKDFWKLFVKVNRKV